MTNWILYRNSKPSPGLPIEVVSLYLGILMYSYGQSDQLADEKTVAWRYFNIKDTQEYSDLRGRASAVLRAGEKGIRPVFQLPGLDQDLITGFMLARERGISNIVNSPALKGGGLLQPETMVFIALFYDALSVDDPFEPEESGLSEETRKLLQRRNTAKLLEWLGPSWKEHWKLSHHLEINPFPLLEQTIKSLEALTQASKILNE